MIGGFLSCGAPDELVDELANQHISKLTIISNDTSYPDADKGKLIVNKQVKRLITSHIGTNPETGRQMNSGELDVELVDCLDPNEVVIPGLFIDYIVVKEDS